MSLVEMAMGWFGAPDAVRRRIDIEGAEHLEDALVKGRGVILFSAHFTPVRILLGGTGAAVHEALRDVQVGAQSRHESSDEPRPRTLLR